MFKNWRKPKPICSSKFKPNGNTKMTSLIRLIAFLSLIIAAASLSAADYPPPIEGDYTIRDFKFASGETLPDLKMHYRTLGNIDNDATGKVTNAVLIMHGTTARGA